MAEHEKEAATMSLAGFVTHQKTGETEGHRHSWVAVNGSLTTLDHGHSHCVLVYGDGVVEMTNGGDPAHTHEPEP